MKPPYRIVSGQSHEWRLLFFVRLAIELLTAGSQAGDGAGFQLFASRSKKQIPIIRGETHMAKHSHAHSHLPVTHSHEHAHDDPHHKHSHAGGKSGAGAKHSHKHNHVGETPSHGHAHGRADHHHHGH